MVPLHQMVHGGHGLLPCPKVWCYLALLTDLELLDHPGQHGSLSNLSSSSDHVVEAPKAFSGGPGCSCSDGKHHRIPPQHYTINWKQQVWTIEFHQFTRFRRSAFETGAATPAQGAPGVPWQPQLQQSIQRKKWMVQLKNALSRVNPPLVNYFVIISGLASGSICGIYLLTLYSGILSDILFWHSIWHLFWHPIWHPFWHPLWDFYGVLSDLLSGTLSDILFRHSIWHIFWHFLPILSRISSDVLSGVLSGIHSGILSGILSDIAIWRLFWHSLSHVLRSGSAHWDLQLVRQRPLRSGVRGWGPAVPTEFWSSRLGPSSAHWDLELAVEEEGGRSRKEGSNSDKNFGLNLLRILSGWRHLQRIPCSYLSDLSFQRCIKHWLFGPTISHTSLFCWKILAALLQMFWSCSIHQTGWFNGLALSTRHKISVAAWMFSVWPSLTPSPKLGILLVALQMFTNSINIPTRHYPFPGSRSP